MRRSQIFSKFKTSTRLQFQASIPIHTRSLATSSGPLWTSKSNTMATPSKIHLTVHDTGVVPYKPQNAETATRTSELLQKNHNEHHVFFNQEGFHNHIVHHLLSLYALGAPTSVIEEGYRVDAGYQRRQLAVEERVLEDLTNPENFKKYLGKEKYYQDFLVFWQQEMEKKGWENVLNEYLFANTEQSEDLLGRMYAGFLHPIIHLGFGIEFHQPAIIAEALAQGAVHDSWITAYLLKAEKHQKLATSSDQKSLPDLLDEIRTNDKLLSSVHFNDPNKIRDGILKRAPDEMFQYTSRWTVTEDNLIEKSAEMTNNAIWFTLAAQNPPKQVKFDFFYMHCVNSSIFWSSINAQSWLSPASKIRLLQWKGYIDLALYVSRRSAKLTASEISDYVPAATSPDDATWPGIFERFFKHSVATHDDGHAVKMGRAVRNGQLVSKRWEDEGKEWLRVKGDMWLKAGNMVIDSVEDTGDTWARNVGFQESWENFGERKKRSNAASL